MKVTIRNILFLIALALIVSVSTITVFFGGNIKDRAIAHFTKGIDTEIKFSNVTFSLVKNFPYPSITISELLILESEKFSSDTLIYSKNATIKISPLILFTNKFELSEINVFNAKLFVKNDINNNKNYNITSNENNENNLNFENLSIQDSEIIYTNDISNINFHLKENNIFIEKKDAQKYLLKCNFLCQRLNYNNKKLIEKKHINFNGPFFLKENNTSIKNAHIKIDQLSSLFSLNFFDENNFILDFKGEEQEISQIILNTPSYLKDIYNSILINGKIQYSGEIKGEAEKENPSLNIDYSISSSSFGLKDNPFYLKEISCFGTISNGLENNFETSSITLKDFIAKTNEGTVEGKGTITNLNSYNLTTDLNYNLSLIETNFYNQDSPFYKMTGRINGDIQYKGNVSFNEGFIYDLMNAEIYSRFNINETSFLYKDFAQKIFIKNAEGIIDSNKINILNSLIKYGRSNLEFSGDIIDLFPNIFNQKPSFHVSGDLLSKEVFVEDFITNNDQNYSKEKLINNMPDYIEADININLAKINYSKIKISKVSGDLNYKNRAFSTDTIFLNAFGGSVKLSGKFYQSFENNFKISTNTKFDNLDIFNTFYTFENFGQSFIQAKHLKGKISSQFVCNASWNNTFELIPEKLQLSSNLQVNEGELINFKPLESLSSFVSIDDLKHIKFSTLKNNIEIKDMRIKVPTMEIKSSAISLLISGYHDFNQEFKYKISLLLSELLASKFRLKNKDYSANADSTEKLITNVQLTMSGDKDKLDISFDKLKMKEHIQEGVKKEIQNIKQIIKEDIIQKKENLIEEELELEWEDDF